MLKFAKYFRKAEGLKRHRLALFYLIQIVFVFIVVLGCGFFGVKRFTAARVILFLFIGFMAHLGLRADMLRKFFKIEEPEPACAGRRSRPYSLILFVLLVFLFSIVFWGVGSMTASFVEFVVDVFCGVFQKEPWTISFEDYFTFIIAFLVSAVMKVIDRFYFVYKMKVTKGMVALQTGFTGGKHKRQVHILVPKVMYHASPPLGGRVALMYYLGASLGSAAIFFM